MLAMNYAAGLSRDLPGIVGGVTDWRIVDSSTVGLHKRLKEIYPGTGDYAAIKVHKIMSVGSGTTISYHFSPAREHDARHLALDESWRGLGLLIDLGYASLKRLRECERYGVRVVRAARRAVSVLVAVARNNYLGPGGATCRAARPGGRL